MTGGALERQFGLEDYAVNGGILEGRWANWILIKSGVSALIERPAEGFISKTRVVFAALSFADAYSLYFLETRFHRAKARGRNVNKRRI